MTSIVLSTLILTATPNSPFKDGAPLEPRMKVEYQSPALLYVSQETSARCNPGGLIRWTPVTALWNIEVGARWKEYTVGISHTSEHGVDKVQPSTESRDYVRIEFKKEFE